MCNYFYGYFWAVKQNFNITSSKCQEIQISLKVHVQQGYQTCLKVFILNSYKKRNRIVTTTHTNRWIYNVRNIHAYTVICKSQSYGKLSTDQCNAITMAPPMLFATSLNKLQPGGIVNPFMVDLKKTWPQKTVPQRTIYVVETPSVNLFRNRLDYHITRYGHL